MPDAASLLAILLPALMFLLASGRRKGLGRTWAFMGGKREGMRPVPTGRRLLVYAILYTSLFEGLLQIYPLLAAYDASAQRLWPNLSISLLAALYGLADHLLLLPLRSRLSLPQGTNTQPARKNRACSPSVCILYYRYDIPNEEAALWILQQHPCR